MWPSWSATPPAIQGRPFLAPIPTSGGPNEWWTDLAGLRHALVGQREAGVKFIPGDPVAYQQGEVGWAIDHRMRFRVGEQEGPFRMTVVYRQEDGIWKMVHFHSSIGVPNEDAIGVELPT
jgi:hypothetical protein